MKYFIVIALVLSIMLTSCSSKVANESLESVAADFNDSLDFSAFLKYQDKIILKDDIIEVDDSHIVELTVMFETAPKGEIELMILANGINVPFEVNDNESAQYYVFEAKQKNIFKLSLSADNLPSGISCMTVVLVTDHCNSRRFRTDLEKYYSFGLKYKIKNTQKGIDDAQKICSMGDVNASVIRKQEYINEKIKWYKGLYPELENYSFEFEREVFLNSVSDQELNVSITTAEYGLPEINFVEIDALTQLKKETSQVMYLRIEGAPGVYRTSLYCNGEVYDAFGTHQTIEITICDEEVVFIPFYAPVYSGLEMIELYALSIPYDMESDEDRCAIFDSRKIKVYYTDEYIPINETSNSLSCEVEYLKGAYKKDNVLVLDADQLEFKISLDQHYRYYKNQYRLMILVNNIPCDFVCGGKEFETKEVFVDSTNEELTLSIDVSNIQDFAYLDVILLPKYNRPMYAYTLLEDSNKVFNTDLLVRSEKYIKNDDGTKDVELTDLMLNLDLSVMYSGIKKTSGLVCLYNSSDKISLCATIEKDTIQAKELLAFVIIEDRVYDYTTITPNNFADEYITTYFDFDKIATNSEITIGVVANDFKGENRLVYTKNYIFIEQQKNLVEITDIEERSSQLVVSHKANCDELYSAYTMYRSLYGYLAPMLGTGRLTRSISTKLVSGDNYSDNLGGENMQIALMTNICKTETYDKGVYRFVRQKTTGVAE